MLDEVRRHLPEGMSPADRTALLDTMNAVFPEARVAWPGAVDVTVQIEVNDKDRHVVAAALWGHADVVLTDDRALREQLEATGVLDVWSMPEFIGYTADANESAAREALIAMARKRWLRDPSASDDAVLARLSAYFTRNGWPLEAIRSG